MTPVSGESNLYSYTFPSEYDKCIFSDSGNNQTGDLTIPSYARPKYNGSRWIDMDNDDPNQTRTIYLDNSKYNYAAPYCHVWSSGTTDSYKTWPGDAMTSLGNNIYSFTCPAEYNCCVFSDNGNNQTGDLKDIPYNSAIYVKDSGWSEYSG